MEVINKLIKYRKVLKQTTLNDIKARYSGSFLGLFWAILFPILFLGCYAFIYIFIFNVRFKMFETNEYVLLIFCGLLPFIAVQDALAKGVSCVVENSNLMKNTMFPIELVPIRVILSSQTMQITGLAMLIVALGFYGRLTIFTPFLIVIWLLQILFNIGVVWIISSLNVVFRDLQNLISIIILFLMMISPIAYPVEMVPDNLKIFINFNPLYYIISSYQDVLMFGKIPDLRLLGINAGMSVLVFFIGHEFFMRMKKVFVDNV